MNLCAIAYGQRSSLEKPGPWRVLVMWPKERPTKKKFRRADKRTRRWILYVEKRGKTKERDTLNFGLWTLDLGPWFLEKGSPLFRFAFLPSLSPLHPRSPSPYPSSCLSALRPHEILSLLCQLASCVSRWKVSCRTQLLLSTSTLSRIHS